MLLKGSFCEKNGYHDSQKLMCENNDGWDLQDELLFTLRKWEPVHIVLKIQQEKKHGVLPTLEIPLLHVKDAAHTDVSLILYKQYSTFLFKIHNKLARWMKTDLSGPKNNYYWSSLGPQQQQHQWPVHKSTPQNHKKHQHGRVKMWHAKVAQNT